HSRPWLSIIGSRLFVSHQHPVISEYLRRGRDLWINNIDISPFNSCTLFCMALHSRASETHTQHTASS
ncbi:unnamed protein product, partial [Staurois parvus]